MLSNSISINFNSSVIFFISILFSLYEYNLHSASINNLSSLSYRQLDRLRDHINYILQIVKSKKDQKDAILSIIYACVYYGADILKAPIEKLIRLTETLMGVNVEDYPDYETIINLLKERSVVKNENRRI